ncbi:MAG: hypothetical protein JXB26_06625 [Candidatus Aminicenantes bacterium]|nr:hypothetical protein [Candidatus Aminicenantes bacterium]
MKLNLKDLFFFAMISMASLRVAAVDDFLFISHTSDYLIKRFNTTSGRVDKIFRRFFPRVKAPKDYRAGSIGYNGRHFSPPKPKYLDDIRSIVSYQGQIWVFTSRTDEKKGVLVDVYDRDGHYMDFFYLDLPFAQKFLYLPPMAFSEQYLWTLGKNEEEMVVIRKYRMISGS